MAPTASQHIDSNGRTIDALRRPAADAAASCPPDRMVSLGRLYHARKRGAKVTRWTWAIRCQPRVGSPGYEHLDDGAAFERVEVFGEKSDGERGETPPCPLPTPDGRMP